MSIQMTSGDGFTRGMVRQYDPVCLYDDTNGMAFGPTFADRAEAEAFVRWLDKDYGLSDLRNGSPASQKATADKWRAFLAEHKASECPYDDESAGVGFLGDRDASDGSGAWTPRCVCECHEKVEQKGVTR